MTEDAVTEALGELLSPSQATTYLACPAKRYFRYLIGLSEPTTGALALGKVFHGTLARNFRQKVSTGRDMENRELSDAPSRRSVGNRSKDYVHRARQPPGRTDTAKASKASLEMRA